MATAGNSRSGDNGSGWDNITPPIKPHSPPLGWKRIAVAIGLILLVGWLAWTWQSMREKALLGAAYAAQTTCVCRYISLRSMESCTADLKAAEIKGVAGMASLAEDPSKHTIIATVPLLTSQRADYHKTRGCQLEPWKD